MSTTKKPNRFSNPRLVEGMATKPDKLMKARLDFDLDVYWSLTDAERAVLGLTASAASNDQ